MGKSGGYGGEIGEGCMSRGDSRGEAREGSRWLVMVREKGKGADQEVMVEGSRWYVRLA